MNKETLIWALGWMAWIAVGAMLVIVIMGSQNTPTVPSLFAYTVELDTGGKVVCVVADHYAGLAIDCAWDK